MRLILGAAAALACMAPAAAAPTDAETISRQAVERLMANHGDVRDYIVVLEHEGVRAPVYVYRDGDRGVLGVSGRRSFGRRDGTS